MQNTPFVGLRELENPIQELWANPQVSEEFRTLELSRFWSLNKLAPQSFRPPKWLSVKPQQGSTTHNIHTNLRWGSILGIGTSKSILVPTQCDPGETNSEVDQMTPTLLPNQRLTPHFTISGFGGFQSVTPQFCRIGGPSNTYSNKSMIHSFLSTNGHNLLRDSKLWEFQISNNFNPPERQTRELTKNPNRRSLRLDRWAA